MRDVPEKDLDPLRDDGTRPGPGEAGEPRPQERPLRLLLAEELRDALGETGLQERAPSIRCRAAISTVRSQSL